MCGKIRAVDVNKRVFMCIKDKKQQIEEALGQNDVYVIIH